MQFIDAETDIAILLKDPLFRIQSRLNFPDDMTSCLIEIVLSTSGAFGEFLIQSQIL